VLRWDQFLSRAVPQEERKTDLDRMHQSFALLLVLEMAYAAADIFPVEVVGQAPDSSSDYVIYVDHRRRPRP
jgi:hypothetical protein